MESRNWEISDEDDDEEPRDGEEADAGTVPELLRLVSTEGVLVERVASVLELPKLETTALRGAPVSEGSISAFWMGSSGMASRSLEAPAGVCFAEPTTG